MGTLELFFFISRVHFCCQSPFRRAERRADPFLFIYFYSPVVQHGFSLPGLRSIQLDGGIESVEEKIRAHFQEQLASVPPPVRQSQPLSALHIGFVAQGRLPGEQN